MSYSPGLDGRGIPDVSPKAESPRAPRAWEPYLAAALLLIAGVAYYGRYFDYGFKVGDEGSLLVFSQRLLEGETPYTELSLGYGPFWYMPVVGLFAVTGVHLVAARVLFFAVAVLTALLGYGTVRRFRGDPFVAATAAGVLLAVPGILHKVFIPLSIVGAMACVSWIHLDRRPPGWKPGFVAALVATVIWLARPDLGLGAGAVLAATLAARVASTSPELREAGRRIVRLAAPAGLGALLPALPVFLDAALRGYLGALVDLLVIAPISQVAGIVLPVVLDGSSASGGAGSLLARTPLSAVFEGGPNRDLAILTYLPLGLLAIVGVVATARTLWGWPSLRVALAREDAGILALAVLVASAFPQFFWFRPDAAHLSQFMPGLVTLLAVCFARWCLPERGRERARAGPVARWAEFAGSIAFAALVFAQVGVYLSFALGQFGMGTIAETRGRTERFEGAHGIEIAVSPGENFMFRTVEKVTEAFTEPGDPVLCFPYCAGYIALAGRTTTVRELYADDSFLISRPERQQQMVAQMEREKPKLVILESWAINGTEISRFQNWARDVMGYLGSEYVRVHRLGPTSFWVRRDIVTGRLKPGRDGRVPD